MAGDEQAKAIGDGGKQIGIVSEHQDRGVVRNLTKRLSNIMRTFPKIADANQPKVCASSSNSDGAVFQNRNLLLVKRSSHSWRVQPPVMISQTGPNSQWRCQVRKHCRSLLWRYEAAAEDFLNNEITRDDNQVGFETVCEFDDLVEFRNSVEGGTNMKVG